MGLIFKFIAVLQGFKAIITYAAHARFVTIPKKQLSETFIYLYINLIQVCKCLIAVKTTFKPKAIRQKPLKEGRYGKYF
ncbi:hypothetical protein COV19_00865 [Candidatus Woesearchaeota archaeon CG10_big_fil_rev_8_21_14_0_10_44_13]|nr:MAG: hypothetical protein COV19_00865 [Candidatus Woesearchaeota archaeon CG10_big_fil_rev_8_21_14_0_10_44_13]